jgi:putative aldouronate transport system permease protein
LKDLITGDSGGFGLEIMERRSALKCADINGKKSNILLKDLKENKSMYLMFSVVLLYYALFCYKPMYGVVIAFKDFSVAKGILGSPWVGLKYFADFLSDPYFGRIIKNTLVISVNALIFGFPAPIILALLLNELKSGRFSRMVQLVVYLPYFISLVVVCGLVVKFTSDRGVINDITAFFGAERVSFLNYPQYFVPTYVVSGIWQSTGYGSIVFLAALTGVEQELYEAATIDGANRWRQALHVSMPGILPTIVTMLVLNVGSLLGVGYEKIMLLYNPLTYSTADVISTYTYRRGLVGMEWSYSAAVGLFNSVINFALLIIVNRVSRRLEGGLW